MHIHVASSNILQARWVEALALVDRGILLGTPVFDHTLHIFAEVLTCEIPISSKSLPKQTVPASSEGAESRTEHTGSAEMRSYEVAVFLRRGKRSRMESIEKARIAFRNYGHIKTSDERLHGATCTGGGPSHEEVLSSGRDRKKLKIDRLSEEIFEGLSDKTTEVTKMDYSDDTSTSGTTMKFPDEQSTAS